jgi:hypothetical protein
LHIGGEAAQVGEQDRHLAREPVLDLPRGELAERALEHLLHARLGVRAPPWPAPSATMLSIWRRVSRTTGSFIAPPRDDDALFCLRVGIGIRMLTGVPWRVLAQGKRQ